MAAKALINLASIFCLTMLSGCSVNRVLNSPPPVDIERVNVGESRQAITSLLGPAKSSLMKQDGISEQYEFVSGYSKGRKWGKSILYISSDICSIGISEWFFDEHEKKTGSSTAGRAVVDYGMDDLAKSILVTMADGETWSSSGELNEEQAHINNVEPSQGTKVEPPSFQADRVLPLNGKVVIVVKDMIGKDLDIPESSIFSAAGKGASSGAVIGAGAGMICYYGFFLCAPVFGTAGGIIGSITGAAVSEPSSTWDKVNNAYVLALNSIDTNTQLTGEIVRIAREEGYDVVFPSQKEVPSQEKAEKNRQIAKEGVSCLLEVSELSVSFKPVNRIPLEIKTLRQVSPRAHVRVIEATTNRVKYEMDIVDTSGPVRSVEEWMAQDEKLLRSEVGVMLSRLARTLVSEVLELQPITVRKVTASFRDLFSAPFDIYYDGLRPVYPQFRPNKHMKLPRVELSPELRWEALPGNNVTYDLRIWRAAEYDSPVRISHGDLVCSQDNLIEPSYTVNVPLEGAKTYLWSVRARFKVDGRQKVTQWSRMSLKTSTKVTLMGLGLPALMPDLMEDRYFMFITDN